MTRSLALTALLAVCVCACARGTPNKQSAPAAGAPAANQAAAPQGSEASAHATATTPQSETEQATAAQESGSDDAEQTRGDTSLERLAALTPEQQLPGGAWKAGVHYDPLVPAQPTTAAPGKIEVVEVFWLGCPHCYALEPYVQSWLKSKPDYITFVRVPVMWGPVHQAHARLYYTLQALGRMDLFEKAFETIQKSGNPLVSQDADSTLKLQIAFATANGITADAYTKSYNSFAVNANLTRAQDLTERYHAESVPLIVVDGKYTTDVSKAGSPEKLFSLINDLAAADHRH